LAVVMRSPIHSESGAELIEIQREPSSDRELAVRRRVTCTRDRRLLYSLTLGGAGHVIFRIGPIRARRAGDPLLLR
jgi:hypothetical protein